MPYAKTDRKMPRGPSLAAPIEVASFWKNRKGDAVTVTLKEWEGHLLIDIRQFFTASDGSMRATKKGISLAIRRLPELAAAILKAEGKARELGLLSEGPTT
jgi:hypothetical protein